MTLLLSLILVATALEWDACGWQFGGIPGQVTKIETRMPPRFNRGMKGLLCPGCWGEHRVLY